MSLKQLSSRSVYYQVIEKPKSPTAKTLSAIPVIGAGNVDLSASQVVNGVVALTLGPAPVAGNVTFTLPSASTCLALLSTSTDFGLLSYTFDFTVINQSTNTVALPITMLASADGSFRAPPAGNEALDQGTSRLYKCVIGLSAAGTYVINTYQESVRESVGAHVLSPYMRNVTFAGTPTANVNYTTSTAAQICDALGWNGPQFIGSTFKFHMQNRAAAAHAITLVGGAGVALSGPVALAAASSRTFTGELTYYGPAPAAPHNPIVVINIYG